ncbi:hypothetical protein Marme_3034 [Marinomonas mediterranea MMB-1]|uniref:Uncharacterized protein n=1 Tax=Marinomonas mediterranea (strain ATCC 700492 / JCM 21426 / NBRC 103028 / MMB-1) TaxID=717774 RepID=F2K1M5_MARM1|nr:hypothetical protein Marme_3034 [Marinomonas mediterranea MMB-1]
MDNNTLILFIFFIFPLFSRVMYLFFKVAYDLFEELDIPFKSSIPKWAIREKILLVGPLKILIYIVRVHPRSFWSLIFSYILVFSWLWTIGEFP